MFSRRSVGEGGYGRRWKEESPLASTSLAQPPPPPSWAGGDPLTSSSLSLSLPPSERVVEEGGWKELPHQFLGAVPRRRMGGGGGRGRLCGFGRAVTVTMLSEDCLEQKP